MAGDLLDMLVSGTATGRDFMRLIRLTLRKSESVMAALMAAGLAPMEAAPEAESSRGEVHCSVLEPPEASWWAQSL